MKMIRIQTIKEDINECSYFDICEVLRELGLMIDSIETYDVDWYIVPSDDALEE